MTWRNCHELSLVNKVDSSYNRISFFGKINNRQNTYNFECIHIYYVRIHTAKDR